MTGTDVANIKESREALKHELQDEDYRYAYVEDFLNTSIATQIVVLREQRGLSQTALGNLIGTKQPGVSRLEDVNHSTWKTGTLKKIARALGVRLKITFETFGSLLDEDQNFGREALQRPEFSRDPAFDALLERVASPDDNLTAVAINGAVNRFAGTSMALGQEKMRIHISAGASQTQQAGSATASWQLGQQNHVVGNGARTRKGMGVAAA